MQLTSMPAVDNKLLGKRLDICEKYDLHEGGTELRWSQGVIMKVSNGSNILRPGARTAKFKKGEGVLIQWDADVAHNEPVTTSAQRLLSTKWNPKGKHTKGSWRFDVSKK